MSSHVTDTNRSVIVGYLAGQWVSGFFVGCLVSYSAWTESCNKWVAQSVHSTTVSDDKPHPNSFSPVPKQYNNQILHGYRSNSASWVGSKARLKLIFFFMSIYLIFSNYNKSRFCWSSQTLCLHEKFYHASICEKWCKVGPPAIGPVLHQKM